MTIESAMHNVERVSVQEYDTFRTITFHDRNNSELCVFVQKDSDLNDFVDKLKEILLPE